MTNNKDESDKKFEAEKKPTTQQDEGDVGNPNAVVAMSAPLLARANPRQEVGEQQCRVQPFSSDQDQVGGSQNPMPPPPSHFRAIQAPGGDGAKGSIGVSPAVTFMDGGSSGGGGVLVGGGAAAAPSVRPISDNRSITSGIPLKRKSDVVAPPGVRPICSVCRRDFYSWKALFGHMRSHPERQWRGCFPPPVEQPQQEQALSAPLPAAYAEAGGAQGGTTRGLNIDLNEPHGPTVDDGAAHTPPLENKKDGRPADFDINKIPPSDDEDIA